MTYGLRILPRADADVDEAAYFIAQGSLEHALLFMDAVESTYRKIRDKPLAFPRFELALPGFDNLRKCNVVGFRDHLIFYRVDADMVVILRVLHGARDIPEVFEESGN